MIHLSKLCRSSAAVAFAAAACFAVTSASAQQYPANDIHFICGFPPGSGADVLVRYFAEKVRPLTGKNIIVENKVGAGGAIGMEYAMRAKPDGYTVFVHAGSGVAASMSLLKNPPIDVAKQVQIAGTINRQPYMIVVQSDKPYKSLADLTAVLKEKGDKGTYGTSNPSSTILAETYKNAMGLKTVEVDYKTGADMVNDLASGALDFGAADPVQALSMAKKGDWRILGLSSGERLKATGDLPTMAEQGVKMDVTGWWAAMVPTGTPKPVVDQINKWFVEVVSSEDTKKFLAQFGGDALVETPEVAQARLLKDIKEWADNVRLAKIAPQG
ncbi:MAG: Bug family tripartite tricarboxylate transporter substrate binding protein [Xanthobacteraceae bacterium]